MALQGKYGEGGEARLFGLRATNDEPTKLVRLVTEHQPSARAVTIASHPALLPVHPVAQGASVVPLVRGRTLADWLERSGPLTTDQVEVVIAVVGDALATLHEAGQVHLDIKPGNIMVDDAGVIMVIDTAGISDAHGGPIRRGTPPFTVPGAPAIPATDWVALGRTALYLRTASAATPLDQLDQALAPLVARMLDGTPPQVRPGGATVLDLPADDFVAPHQRRTIDFGPYGQQPTADIPTRRRLPASVLAGAVAAACLAGLWSSAGTACPSAPNSATAQHLEIDVGADCPALVSFDDSTGLLTVWSDDEPTRFSIGQPGDRLVLGDWNCDSFMTPGLQRGTQLLVFDHWPTDQPEIARTVATRPTCPSD